MATFAVVSDVADFAYVMRGKDYGLLDHTAIGARLHLPADQHLQSSESGVCRTLYDCPDQRLSESGPLVRVIVATHPAPTRAKKKRQVGLIRDGVVRPPHNMLYTVGESKLANVGLPNGLGVLRILANL